MAAIRMGTGLLGFVIAEEDPEHGDVFMTLGDNLHTLDIGQHPAPGTAQRPERGQIGLGHIAFQVGSYAALRDAYAHLVGSGVEILRATNDINQRSFYFADPDGNTLEIYYELPCALELFPEGRDDQDEALMVSGPGDPLPDWLLAGARDESENRELAPRRSLSIHREREAARCWSTLHAPPPATKR